MNSGPVLPRVPQGTLQSPGCDIRPPLPPHPPGRDVLGFVGGGRGAEEEGQQGEAHFATVTPGNAGRKHHIPLAHNNGTVAGHSQTPLPQ